MQYIKHGESDLTVFRIRMGFDNANNGQHSWTIDEESYVPHNLVGSLAEDIRFCEREPCMVYRKPEIEHYGLTRQYPFASRSKRCSLIISLRIVQKSS